MYAQKFERRLYVEKAVEYAVKIHSQLPLGDILVFLTGEEEINRACKVCCLVSASLILQL